MSVKGVTGGRGFKWDPLDFKIAVGHKNCAMLDDRSFLQSEANFAWWRHQMEIFSALLAICAGNSPAHGEFPAQRPVTRNFDIYFDMHPNNQLSKQLWGWWFETQSRPLWRHRNGKSLFFNVDLKCYFRYKNNSGSAKLFNWVKMTINASS